MPFYKVLDCFQQNSYFAKKDLHPLKVKNYNVTGFEFI